MNHLQMISAQSIKDVKFISDRLYSLMQKNGISLTILESFAQAQKVLSMQDLFDYIAYNDKHVVSQLLCSDRIKQTYLTWLYSAFELSKDYEYKHIQNVIKPAFNELYPEMDVENSYTALPNNLVKHNQSTFNALAVLVYGSSPSFAKPLETAAAKPVNINFDKAGNINLPQAGDTPVQTYSHTNSFFKIIETGNTVFVVIKPDIIQIVGNHLEDIVFNNNTFSICEDIGENEPTTLQENMFMRIVSAISKNGRDKYWAHTPLGHFYFKVFVVN